MSPRLLESEAFASCFNTLFSLRPIELEAIHIDAASARESMPGLHGAARTLELAFLNKLACLNSPPRALPAGRRRPQAPYSREHALPFARRTAPPGQSSPLLQYLHEESPTALWKPCSSVSDNLLYARARVKPSGPHGRARPLRDPDQPQGRDDTRHVLRDPTGGARPNPPACVAVETQALRLTTVEASSNSGAVAQAPGSRPPPNGARPGHRLSASCGASRRN